MNADGSPDLLTANRDSRNVSVLLGNPDGTFQDARNFRTSDGPAAVTAADFDGDGNLDLATANSSSHRVSVLPGNGDGTFGFRSIFRTGTGPQELVAPEKGDGSFFPVQDLSTANAESLIAVDLDRDGAIDIATANLNDHKVSVFLNESTPPSSTDCNVNGIPDECDISSEPALDLDADGTIDSCQASRFRRGDSNREERSTSRT